MAHLPVADPSILNICMVILVTDGLLRTRTRFTMVSPSSTLYNGCLKNTVAAVELKYV